MLIQGHPEDKEDERICQKSVFSLRFGPAKL